MRKTHEFDNEAILAQPMMGKKVKTSYYWLPKGLYSAPEQE
jgi:hypothetical protein